MNKKLKKLAGGFVLLALFISPLIFFTEVTRNPYLIQERILQVFLSLGLVALYLTAGDKEYIKLPRTFLDKPLIVFFIFCILSVGFSFIRYWHYRWAITDYAGRRMLMFTFSGMAVFYFTAGFAKNKKVLTKIKNVTILAGTLASFYAIMQFANMDFIWGRELSPYGERSISTFGNPNFLSSYLLITIYWIIGEIFTERKTALWLVILLINLGGLAITMTRSTYAALFLGLLLFSYFMLKEYGKKSNKIKKIIAGLLGILISIFVIFSIASPQFKNRVESFFSIEKMGSALTQRLMIWEASANMFQDTPVVGRGWGNFEIFYPFYQGEIVSREDYQNLRTHANNSHNFIFELLTQVGILGTGIYIWLIITFIIFGKHLYKKVNKDERIHILIFTVAGISFWIDNLLNVSLYFPIPAMAFWLNAGLLAAAGRENEDYPVYSFKKNTFYIPGLLFLMVLLGGVTAFNYKYFTASSYFFQGFKHSRQNKLIPAEEKLLQAHNRYSLIVDNNYELGNVYGRMAGRDKKYLEKAIWAYNEAIKANPGYDEIYFNLGVMHLRNNQPEKAEEILNTSLEINPISARTLSTFGDIKGRAENYKEAKKYYKRAVKFNPGASSIWNNYGYYTEKTGDLKKAITYYLKALKLNSNFNEARNNIKRAYSKIRNNVDSEKINNLFKMAGKNIDSQNWEQSFSKIEEILEINPLNLNALLYAGNIQFQLQNPQKAKDYYQKILLIDPDNKTAKENLKKIEDNE
ncbi:MAG: tetratricopeptide repeat protein [Elusimicrobiota bacterium]